MAVVYKSIFGVSMFVGSQWAVRGNTARLCKGLSNSPVRIGSKGTPAWSQAIEVAKFSVT